MKPSLKIVLNLTLLSLTLFISCKDEPPRLDPFVGLALDSGLNDLYQESYIGDTLVVVLRNLDKTNLEYIDLDFYRTRRGLNNEELSRYQHRFETFYDIGFNDTIRFAHFVPDSTAPSSIVNVEGIRVTDRLDIRFKRKLGRSGSIASICCIKIGLIKKD